MFKKYIFLLLLCPLSGFAYIPQKNSHPKNLNEIFLTLIEDRTKKEDRVLLSDFAITFYKQNYILPFYFTGSPYNRAYQNITPNGQQVKKSEIKYQISLKVPIWKNILSSRSNLFFAYTQLSYWQAYNKTAFFRETDYQPEAFISTDVKWPITRHWAFNQFNVGFTHQSNGLGSQMERSWNRLYLETIASNPNWMVSIKPWYVFRDPTYLRYNPHLARYLGYGEITVGGKFSHQVVTLQLRSLFEQGGRYKTGILTYSFPLTYYLHGFVEVFSGYGQSLVEFDHRNNSFGVGIALSNLV